MPRALYVMMMYISVCKSDSLTRVRLSLTTTCALIDPIAMSVRSTNVYEEKSLGIFDDEEDEQEPDTNGSRVAVWGRYLAWHARKQLAFGTHQT